MPEAVLVTTGRLGPPSVMRRAMPRCGRAVPQRSAYPARTVRSRAWLMIRILPGSSRRSVPAGRSQIAFVRGACRRPVTIRRPQDPTTAPSCPANWLPRGDLARFAFLPAGNDGEHANSPSAAVA